MLQNILNGKSTWVQVMVWCHQTTSQYLSQCWPSSMVPLGHTGLMHQQWSSISGTNHQDVLRHFMFNCYEDTWKFVLIFCYFPALVMQVVKSCLMENKDLFIIYGQCHGCWWPGVARSQGISSHSIVLPPHTSIFSIKELTWVKALFAVTRGPFYWHGLTLIPTWISYHMSRKVWVEITYPFPNFNGCTIGV